MFVADAVVEPAVTCPFALTVTDAYVPAERPLTFFTSSAPAPLTSSKEVDSTFTAPTALAVPTGGSEADKLATPVINP